MQSNLNNVIMTAKKHRLSTAEVIKNANEIFHKLRWAHGIVVCPYCGSIHIKQYDGYHYKCNSCKNRFSDKTNTLMHGSKLPISAWLQAIYEMSVDNFISSNVLASKLGINQKSAWLLQTKIRYSLTQDKVILQGMIRQDEMYIGGSLSNYHYSRKWKLLRDGNYVAPKQTEYTKEVRDALFKLSTDLKQPVFGMSDGDKVVLYATPNPIKKEYLRKAFKKHVRHGSITVSDESQLYINWEQATGSELHVNNHHNNQYATEDGFTSNTIENLFSWYKRGFNGKITHCKYHQFYLNEFCFRFNNRNASTNSMFAMIVNSTIGKHITYKQIREYTPYRMFITKAKQQEINKAETKRMKAIKWILENTTAESIKSKGKIYTISYFQ